MYDVLIEIGIALLLIYMPLAFGGVMPGSIAFMEIIIAALTLIWLAKIAAQRHEGHGHHADAPNFLSFRAAASRFWLLCGALIGLALLQCLPLPSLLVKWLSPAGYRLYADAAAAMSAALPAWLPLSVCADATRASAHELLAYFMLFVVMVHVIRSPRQIRRIAAVIIAVGLLESLYGMLEYFSGRNQIFFMKKTFDFRVTGTFVNKNHFAGFMELVIPLTFSLLFVRLNERTTAVTKRMVRFLDEKYMKVFLMSFLLCILICALLLSSSRGGFISFIGGMACLLFLSSQRRLLRKKAVIALCVLLFSAAGALTVGYAPMVKRLKTFASIESDRSFQLRKMYWQDTLTMARDFPAFGAGLGTFAHIYPAYQTFPSDITVEYAENDYAQMLGEMGVPGFALAVGIVAYFLRATWKAWKAQQSRWAIMFTAGGLSALCSLLLHSWVDFNLRIPSNALLFTVIAAMTTVAAHTRRRSSR